MLLAASLCAAADRGQPPREGIGNFGQVDERLYRGAQPDADGIANLKRLGVKSIINLRTSRELWKPEPSEARTNGILYTNVPLSGLSRPSEEQITRLLSLLETLPSPVFIHCEYGCDRTGTVVACYRIKHDKWSSEDAQKEADHYGMSKLERGMRNFIKDFAAPPPTK
jgi:protein tyrosine/serine phosphatase